MKNVFNGQSNKSGVYKIINIASKRIYIGSAKRFKQRSKEHFATLRKGTHHNKFLQYDFNKCGEETFEFHVIKVVDGNQSDRLLAEQNYLDKFYDKQDLCYNFDKKTNKNGRSCYTKTPEETFRKKSEASKRTMSDPSVRKRISEAHKKRLSNPKDHPMYGIKGKDNPRFGMKHTTKAKRKIAEASRGNKNCLGRVVPQEVREKISKALRGRKLSEETKEKMRLARLRPKTNT